MADDGVEGGRAPGMPPKHVTYSRTWWECKGVRSGRPQGAHRHARRRGRTQPRELRPSFPARLSCSYQSGSARSPSRGVKQQEAAMERTWPGITRQPNQRCGPQRTPERKPSE
eukprot:358937-Chlamydomonas_euryale.AAC.17